jgi:hypothetical protein
MLHRRCNMPAGRWKKVGKGIEVLKLWESIGPEWPQIALLLLSKEEYKEFLKNPKNYLNGFKIFDTTPTRKVTRCHLASVKPTTATYMIVAKHEMDCTCVAMSSSNVK